MYCTQCGCKNNSDAKFCNDCGKPIGETTTRPPLVTVKGSPATIKGPPVTSKKPRSRKKVFWVVALLFLLLLVAIGFCSGPNKPKRVVDGNDQKPVVIQELEFKIVSYSKEVFPVITKYLAGRTDTGEIEWQIVNKGDKPRDIVVASSIQDWTSPRTNTVKIGPKQTIKLEQTPYGDKLLQNGNLTPAQLKLTVKENDKVIFDETRSINLRPVDDIIWEVEGTDLSDLIAAWVTPKDPSVERVLSGAKERMSGNKFTGYQSGRPEVVKQQMKAIFNELRELKVSYVNSPINFGQPGATQRVRLPYDSISKKSANCIDISVLLASLYENIGFQPVIILVPGHAFLGVRESEGSNILFFVEATIIGRPYTDSIFSLQNTFDAALEAGDKQFDKHKADPKTKVVDIRSAREKRGVYPLLP